jgi:hypothetical protein
MVVLCDGRMVAHAKELQPLHVTMPANK